jgi:hypothetical protein
MDLTNAMNRMVMGPLLEVEKDGLLAAGDFTDMQTAMSGGLEDVRTLLTTWSTSHAEAAVQVAAQHALEKLQAF